MTLSNDLCEKNCFLIIFVISIMFLFAVAMFYINVTSQLNNIQINNQLVITQISKDLEAIQNHVLSIQQRRDFQWQDNANSLAKINEKISNLQVEIISHHPNAKRD